MKKSVFYILCLSLLLAGCLKDESNYNFSQPEVITVSGLEPSITAVSGMDNLRIDPVASSNKEGELEYMWGIYETNVQGYAPVLDTLASTKELNYNVQLPAKGWVLVLRVTNTQTGYAQFFTSSLNVVTPYTRGWYVAKDDGSNTDLDLFLTPETIVPDSKVENVFSTVNGHKIPGKAMLLNYYNDYKSDVLVAGTFVNTKSMFIIADKGMSVVDINSLDQIHDLDGIFYQAPSVKQPDFVSAASAALYFSNNGQLTSIYSMSANTGQFGTEKIMDDEATPYRLSKYHIGSGLADGPVLFDELSGSFVTATGSGTTMTSYKNSSSTTMEAQNTNKTCLYMGTRSNYPLEGIAVLRDKTNPTLLIVSSVATNGSNFTAINDTVSASAVMQTATRFAVNTEENIVYFVVGNQVWSHNMANDFEKMQWEAPSGEDITFLRHRAYKETGYAYNYIMIGTKQAGNYKVRMFTKSSGNLATTPEVTLEGTGEVGDVLYVSPSTGSNTYLNNY
ncbi:PKD-like family protein [Arachidicoccus rhizosphaerae]|uniref:PKD-like family protein n=1 Tax=Arachidicoccus rhizosphaerae TaxID=551991 RepID=A0A1H3VSY0_9BACT|nr:PKD-like family lipoprotein [Arachidicoccus rhizosphaerae]SDZ77876.1 PKD-like family protein [Arachidicoccus rhizosphaerae]